MFTQRYTCCTISAPGGATACATRARPHLAKKRVWRSHLLQHERLAAARHRVLDAGHRRHAVAPLLARHLRPRGVEGMCGGVWGNNPCWPRHSSLAAHDHIDHIDLVVSGQRAHVTVNPHGSNHTVQTIQVNPQSSKERQLGWGGGRTVVAGTG
eukprot:360759-Chlamydomonas_euryale.AAC.6